MRMSTIPPEVVVVTGKLLKEGIKTVVGPMVFKKTKKWLEKDHGSKVKEKKYRECPIELFGDMACIITDIEKGEIVLLTSENIKALKFVKEKERGFPLHTYYYYKIEFKDNSESYVRMRRKYRDAMLKYTQV